MFMQKQMKFYLLGAMLCALAGCFSGNQEDAAVKKRLPLLAQHAVEPEIIQSELAGRNLNHSFIYEIRTFKSKTSAEEISRQCSVSNSYFKYEGKTPIVLKVPYALKSSRKKSSETSVPVVVRCVRANGKKGQPHQKYVSVRNKNDFSPYETYYIYNN